MHLGHCLSENFVYLQKEKEEMKALKNSAPEVDADEESRARLAALRGEAAEPAPKKAVDLPFRTAQVSGSHAWS